MDTQDAGATLKIWKSDIDLTIETSRTQQGLIQNVNTIGSSNGNDSWVTVETVHLDQNLVHGLFSLVVTAGVSSTTLATYRIDLINKDDARGVLLSLSENVTYTRCTNTNKHLNEFRTRNTDERNSGFASDGLGKKSFTGTGRTVQNNSTGDLTSIRGVGLWLLQKVNNFGQFQFGSVASGNIIKSDSRVRHHLDFSLALSKPHWVAWAATHATTGTSRASAQEEKTREENSREDEALCKLSESASFLCWQDGNVNLKI
jgi:predicted flap endonuclease-1-like 5' DNA nuclease